VLQTLVAEIYGPNEEDRLKLAEAVKNIFKSTPGVVDVDWYIEADQQKARFVIDKEKAALHGISAATISQTLKIAVDGETVDLASRRVNLYAAELVDCPSPDLAVIRVTCGKGFYIRALVRDIAAALGAEGHVAALRRTRVGAFAEAAAITLPFLQQMSDKPALDDTLVPLETALDDIPALAITGEEASRLRQGREIVLLPHQVEAFREMRRPRQVNGEDASRICLATEKVGEEQLGVALGEVRAGRFMPVRVFNQ
jgi:tRNA pseudouridine55 synthase